MLRVLLLAGQGIDLWFMIVMEVKSCVLAMKIISLG